MMKKIPDDIDAIFCRRMKNASIAFPLQQEYRKWLRFYLDFCSKYYLAPTDRETPVQFMQKINEKGQSAEKQKQAGQSINVYLDIVAGESEQAERQKVRDFGSVVLVDTPKPDSGWSDVFKKLNEAVRLRNYSKKTFRTYAS